MLFSSCQDNVSNSISSIETQINILVVDKINIKHNTCMVWSLALVAANLSSLYITHEHIRIYLQPHFQNIRPWVASMDGLLNRPIRQVPRGPRGHRSPVPDPLFEVTVNISCWKVNQTTAKQNNCKEMQNSRRDREWQERRQNDYNGFFSCFWSNSIVLGRLQVVCVYSACAQLNWVLCLDQCKS